MIALNIQDVKKFTSELFVHEMFDEFLMSEMDIAMAQSIHIDGTINKDWYTNEELEAFEGRRLTKWKEIKPLAFEMIKGKRTPLAFKMIFELNETQLTKLVERSGSSFKPTDVSGLYIHVKFDKNGLTVITGSSIKVFSMDKSLEYYWDDTVKLMMKKYQIAAVEA
ncbi:MAG: DUF5721 family protein [bacterium]|nr:DUF5721 family protein [bacterium]